MTHSLADDLRGQAFLPEESALAEVPRLYATENIKVEDKIAHLHFFTGPCDWYICEIGEDRRIAFEWVDLGDTQNAELGYIDLTELRELFIKPYWAWQLPVYVERDLHWEPKHLRDCCDL